MSNRAWPFDVCLTPFISREGGRECGFWSSDDLHNEVIDLLVKHNDDAPLVAQIFADRGLSVAIQQWTWQEDEFNRRVFGAEPRYPDVNFFDLVRGIKRAPMIQINKKGG